LQQFGKGYGNGNPEYKEIILKPRGHWATVHPKVRPSVLGPQYPIGGPSTIPLDNNITGTLFWASKNEVTNP